MAGPAANPSAGQAPAGGRYVRLDALRGVALVWMTVYHFSFDLNHFGYIRQDFYRDPVWTWQRTAILSLFLFTAGCGQVLAVQAGQGWPRFWRRWLQIAACAVLVSAGSWWMFPRSWISFGVLHGLALMLLLARLLLANGHLKSWGPWLLAAVLIAAASVLGQWVQTQGAGGSAAMLDTRWLNWLGVVSAKPVTEDYVPLLPWLGVLLLGVGVARGWSPQAVARAPRPLGWLGQCLARLGRWSLSYYMLHQPVLIGGLLGWRMLMG